MQIGLYLYYSNHAASEELIPSDSHAHRTRGVLPSVSAWVVRVGIPFWIVLTRERLRDPKDRTRERQA